VLLRWLPGHAGGAADGVAPAPTATAAAAPNRAAIVQRFGSEHVASVMIDSMRSTTEDDLQRSQAAREDSDSEVAVEVLHRIVGGLGTLGAMALADQARRVMEQIDAAGVDACHADIDAFEQALRAYLASLQAS
ncbi:Hpt domain-containing protein, partial [Stenotrophomonas sp. HMWF003]|uniref:Hpt domain-containing protein n=1 Tax=Stenotrophomonas sp. HMWF003 TaxID=2056840 RepID=UPI002159DAF6